jgi:TRAP-type C4-dicarboxylate transport system permease small subunit
MKDLKSLSDVFSKLYKAVVILFTFLLFVIVAYNVIRRYLFNNSIAWADELSRYIFIWVNLLGIISVFQNDELIKLDIVSKIISRTKFGKYFIAIVEFVSVSTVLAILTFYSFKFLSVMNHVSATLALPMKLVYSILPISMSCMFFGNIVILINIIKNRKS